MISKSFHYMTKTWMILTFVFLYLPIVTIVVMSFNKTAYGLFPYVFTTEWYKVLFTTSSLVDSAVRSLEFSAIVTVTAVIIGTITALGMQSFTPKWANRLSSALQLPITIPWLVTAISILLLMTFIGFGRSYFAMFFGNLVVVLPYVVLLVNGRFVAADRTPEAAARLLGASPVRVFFDVTLPEILPGVMAGGIMSFIVCYNSFCIQYYLAPFAVYTLPVEVFTRIKTGYQADLNALSAVMILVALIIVFVLSRLGYDTGSLFGGAPVKTKKGK